MHTDKPCRILEIGPYPPPGTGWSIRIKMLKKCIERSGHACVVLNTNKNRRLKSAEYVSVDSGVDYFLKVLTYCARGFLVHMHLNGKSTKSPVLALIAELVSLLFLRPAVLTFHAGPVQDYFPRQGKLWLVSVFRLIFLLAGKIICNHDEVKARIVEYGIRPEKIIPIPGFCVEYLEDKSGLPAPVADFVRQHAPVICSHVYMRPDFNMEAFVPALAEAVKLWPHLGIVLMGADNETGTLRDMLKRHLLTDNAYIAGDLEHGEFLAVLETCQAYVRTPVVDGISSSVLEALMLGTPVVASENGNRPPGVITYTDGEVESFLHALNVAFDNQKPGDPVPDPDQRARVAERLGIGDTIGDELSVLFSAAR